MPASTAAATITDKSPEVPSRRLDLVGRALMGVNVVLTLGAFAGGLVALADAEESRLMVEGWRTFGYLAFAGMWAMLALAPRRVPAIWELVIVSKALVTAWAIAILGAPEAGTAAVIDSWLVVSTVFAYIVCRGWISWRLVRTQPPAASN